MKTYKEIIAEVFGREALSKKLKTQGFGTKEKEEELLSQKSEMEKRHAKADTEMAARSAAWKAKYAIKESQEHTSADTSLNQVSAGLKHAVKTGLIQPNSVNVDVGGGKYDAGKEHVESNVKGAKLHISDPFNRSEEHNANVDKETEGKADYTSLNNVANVIKEPEHRIAAYHKVKSFMKPKTGVAHITVYEGDKTGNARQTKNDKGRGSSWQNHAKTDTYLPEIKKVFPEETHDVSVKSGHIIIRQK